MSRGFRDEDETGFSMGNVTILRTTPSGKALVVELHDHNYEEVCVPISQVHDDSEAYDDNENSEGELKVTNWWAKKNGYLDE